MMIQEWEWDDGNLNELGRHGLTPRVVKQVAGKAPRFRANKAGRAATHQMIGPDAGGTIWVVCIVAVLGTDGRWRAITGWRAGDREKKWYGRAM